VVGHLVQHVLGGCLEGQVVPEEVGVGVDVGFWARRVFPLRR
jgi:hypothetical protein